MEDYWRKARRPYQNVEQIGGTEGGQWQFVLFNWRTKGKVGKMGKMLSGKVETESLLFRIY